MSRYFLLILILMAVLVAPKVASARTYVVECGGTLDSQETEKYTVVEENGRRVDYWTLAVTDISTITFLDLHESLSITVRTRDGFYYWSVENFSGNVQVPRSLPSGFYEIRVRHGSIPIDYNMAITCSPVDWLDHGFNNVELDFKSHWCPPFINAKEGVLGKQSRHDKLGDRDDKISSLFWPTPTPQPPHIPSPCRYYYKKSIQFKSVDYSRWRFTFHSARQMSFSQIEYNFNNSFSSRIISGTHEDGNAVLEIITGPGDYFLEVQEELNIRLSSITYQLVVENLGPIESASNPNIVFQPESFSKDWQAISFPEDFAEPEFDLDSAQMFTNLELPGSTFGFIETKEYLAPLPKGIYRFWVEFDRYSSEDYGSRPKNSVLPDVRVRIFTHPLNQEVINQAVSNPFRDRYESMEFLWESDGVTPWRMAIDLLAFEPNRWGGFRIKRISWKRID